MLQAATRNRTTTNTDSTSYMSEKDSDIRINSNMLSSGEETVTFSNDELCLLDTGSSDAPPTNTHDADDSA